MSDYKSMYYRLFNRISDAIEMLKAAQVEGEDAFVKGKDSTVIELVENEDKPEDSK